MTPDALVYRPTAQRVAHAILSSDAYLIRVGVSEDDFFVWKSKIRAPVYCDVRRTVNNPGAAALLQRSLAAAIRSNFKFDYIIGVAEAGIMWSMASALELSAPHAFVRKTEKKHGMAGRIACGPPRGISCVLVDDLVASGESLGEAIRLLAESGITTVGIQSIVNWNFREMRERFERLDVPVRALVSYPELLQCAHELRRISGAAVDELSKFYADPRKHEWDVTALTPFAAADIRNQA